MITDWLSRMIVTVFPNPPERQMNRMQALVKDGPIVGIRSISMPSVAETEVLVKVMVAGLCRTDVYAADGKIKTADPLVLGHEVSGVVAAVGSAVKRLEPGDRVAINPLLPCGECGFCSCHAHGHCQKSKFLGIDRHGSFAGYVAIPEQALYLIPSNVSFVEAAYAEPVAASLAVLKTGIDRNQKGIIYGKNRFAELTHRVLTAKGFNRVEIYDPRSRERIASNRYDYAIETVHTVEAMQTIVNAIHPGGKIILKGRQHEPISIELSDLIRKEPTLHAVNYGSFQEALQMIGERHIVLGDMIESVYPLTKFQQVFEQARNQGLQKPFFDLAAVS